jgi:signal peptidase I
LGGPRRERRGGALRLLKELPVLIALALLIALLIKAFLVQAFFIPSASMEPTLHIGDRVLVNKLSYRLGEPERGDIVVFRDPYPDPCDEEGATGCDDGIFQRSLNWIAEVFGLPTGETRDFIKRIVALPGETIAIQDGEVYVCPDPGCRPIDSEGEPFEGRKIEFPNTDDEGPQIDDDDQPAFTVPDDEYYVLGDNRANSRDSRVFRGIERDEIVGKAFIVIWPFSRFNTI